MKIWEAGDRRYEHVEGWGELREGQIWGEAAGVAVDAEDNLHLYTRAAPPYRIFDKTGKLLDHWGEGIFDRGHYITLTTDSVFFVDYDTHVVMKFDQGGRHLMTLGNRWQPSDSGWNDTTIPHPQRHEVNAVMQSAPPFNRPTDVIVSQSGDIFVSDGYRNSRVHKFSGDGVLIKSWGEPGDARDLRDTDYRPGYFHNPHSISEHKGRIYVCDRENNRIQIFDLEGNFLNMWLGFKRPCKIYISPEEEVAYVAELEARVSILDLEGNVIGRFGGEQSNEPGELNLGVHGICKDSEESLYVSETMKGLRVMKFARVK